MIGTTPVGIFTYLPAESRRFYRVVLGLEQVYSLRDLETEEGRGCILRLESPQIEVLSVETREYDVERPRTLRGETRLLLHPRDPAALHARLRERGVTITAGLKDSFRFEDLNGISWEAYSS
ncbi:MAG: VOC family protein [Candidatus Ozemobacteraceae bacterium]